MEDETDERIGDLTGDEGKSIGRKTKGRKGYYIDNRMKERAG